MARSGAATVAAYLKELGAERGAVVSQVREAIRAKIPPGYEEVMSYGMIAWQVPLKRHSKTYNGQPLLYAALAAQKNNYAVYLTCAAMDPKHAEALRTGFRKAGKKLDMGKSCVRFARLEDLALDAIVESIASVKVDDYVAASEKARIAKK